MVLCGPSRSLGFNDSQAEALAMITCLEETQDGADMDCLVDYIVSETNSLASRFIDTSRICRGRYLAKILDMGGKNWKSGWRCMKVNIQRLRSALLDWWMGAEDVFLAKQSREDCWKEEGADAGMLGAAGSSLSSKPFLIAWLYGALSDSLSEEIRAVKHEMSSSTTRQGWRSQDGRMSEKDTHSCRSKLVRSCLHSTKIILELVKVFLMVESC